MHLILCVVLATPYTSLYILNLSNAKNQSFDPTPVRSEYLKRDKKKTREIGWPAPYTHCPEGYHPFAITRCRCSISYSILQHAPYKDYFR